MKLEDARYEQIKREIANFLEDYDVKEFPIDVFAIAKKMKAKVDRLSEISEKYLGNPNGYLRREHPDSFVTYDSESQQFIIYIDDLGTRERRQRFSMAHELMHIILGHSEQSEKNESEANYGATYLLAPASLSLIEPDNGILLDPDIVSELFEVSASEAKIIVRYYSNRLSLHDLSEKDYEKTINDLLRDSFKAKLREYR